MAKYFLLMLIIFNPVLLANDIQDRDNNEINDNHYTLEIEYLIHDKSDPQGKSTDATFINFKNDSKNFTMDFLLKHLIYDLNSKAISCKDINKNFKDANFHFQLDMRRISLKTIYDATKDKVKLIQLKNYKDLKDCEKSLKRNKFTLGKYNNQVELSTSKNQALYQGVCTSLENLNKCLEENSQVVVIDDNTIIKRISPSDLSHKPPLPNQQKSNKH